MNQSPKTILTAFVMIATSAVWSSDITDVETFRTDKAVDVRDGFLPVWIDQRANDVYVELEDLPLEAVFIASIATGLGSNDVGLDRGRLRTAHLVRFERSGDRVVVSVTNQAFRATSENPYEVGAAREAFAYSILASLPIVAEGDETVIVDIEALALRDVAGIVQTLDATGQGSFSVVADRSLLMSESSKAFPDNTVIRSALTLSGSKPGSYVRDVSPDPYNVTIEQKIDFIRPPAPGYAPRIFHPRAGYFPFRFYDYGAPIDEQLEQLWIPRHRLTKATPGVAPSDPVEPIVYYLDPGVPEPVRSALLTGGGWWSDAFEAAGFTNAFRIESLPEDVDIDDTRFNIIFWVHRATRGWSYGRSILDPRTGEIIRGVVTLGSLRVRQDLLIFESLLGEASASAAQQAALRRLEQLSAHEIGHTLGLAHNFAASGDGDHSVMDYPHPGVEIRAGEITLDEAYATGMSEWDKLTIRYGYATFEDERTGLEGILGEMQDRDLTFVSDIDARPPGATSALGHLWDNAESATTRLRDLADVRRLALAELPRTIRTGRPQASLEHHLVPIYLIERYQIEAVSKLIGGQYYEYRMAADTIDPPRWVPPGEQADALDALLDTLKPAALSLPDDLRGALDPASFAWRRDREAFTHRTGEVFDALAPARALTQLVVGQLLQPLRLNRVALQRTFDTDHISVRAFFERIRDDLLSPGNGEDYASRIEQQVAFVTLNEMMRVYASGDLTEAVAWEIRRLLVSIQANTRARLFQATAAPMIRAFLDAHDRGFEVPEAETIPPGSPI